MSRASFTHEGGSMSPGGVDGLVDLPNAGVQGEVVSAWPALPRGGAFALLRRRRRRSPQSTSPLDLGEDRGVGSQQQRVFNEGRAGRPALVLLGLRSAAVPPSRSGLVSRFQMGSGRRGCRLAVVGWGSFRRTIRLPCFPSAARSVFAIYRLRAASGLFRRSRRVCPGASSTRPWPERWSAVLTG